METSDIKHTGDDPKEVPAQVPELKELDVFVGRWRAEGQSFGERGIENNLPPESWTSEETYEWIPGGHFLLHRWDARVGSKEFTGIEIIGYDKETQSYFAHLFDNLGNKIIYTIVREQGGWRYSEPASRATVIESIDGSTMEWKWESQQQGGRWNPICTRTAIKLR